MGQRRQDVLPSTTGKPIIRFNTQGYWRPLTQVCKHHAPLVSTWSFLQHCVVAQLWPEGQVWPPLPLGSWLGGGGGGPASTGPQEKVLSESSLVVVLVLEGADVRAADDTPEYW